MDPPTGLHFPHHPSLFSLSAPIQSSFSPSHLQNSWKTSAPIFVSCSLKRTGLNCHCWLSTVACGDLAYIRRRSFLIPKHPTGQEKAPPQSLIPCHPITTLHLCFLLIHLRCSMMSEPHTYGLHAHLFSIPRRLPLFIFLLSSNISCSAPILIQSGVQLYIHLPYLHDLSNFPFILQR